MVHHWRASDGLVPTPNPSEWMLYDRSTLIGYCQRGKLDRQPSWRGVIRQGDLEQVVGYSPTLEQCATDFWNWYIRFVKASERA